MAPLGNEPAGTEKRGSGFGDESGSLPVAFCRRYPGMCYRERAIARCPAERLQHGCTKSWHYSSHREARPKTRVHSPPKHRVRSPILPRMSAPGHRSLVSVPCSTSSLSVLSQQRPWSFFFGLGFFLLIHPNEVLIAGARDRGIEVEPRRTDPGSPEKDAATLTVQTELPNPAAASAGSVAPGQPPEAREVLPPADRDTAWASLPASAANMVAANATSDASSSRELRELRDEATLATPGGVTHAKRTGIGRRRHDGARKHWAGVSRPGANGRPAPAASGLEEVRRWIVQSATGILAALSPPPPRQSSGFKTH